MSFKIYEIDTSVEGEVRGSAAELSVMEVMVHEDLGTWLTGYNHTTHNGFVQQIFLEGGEDPIPELKGEDGRFITFNAARREMTPEVVTRAMEASKGDRIEVNGDVDRVRLIKDTAANIQSADHLSAGGAFSVALLQQYEQIPAERHQDIVLRNDADQIIATLADSYPDGPKSGAELSAASRAATRDPFTHNFGTIGTNRVDAGNSTVVTFES